jgi:hypothetical protein
MATVTDEEDHHEGWYLDTGCSNHMTSHREWLVNLNDSSKTKIRFADNRTIPAEGVGDVLIKGKKGNQALITGVLYVPAMKTNLLSITSAENTFYYCPNAPFTSGSGQS